MSPCFSMALLGQSLPSGQSAQRSVEQVTETPAPDGSTGTMPRPHTDFAPATVVLGERLPVQLGLTVTGYYDDNIYVEPNSAGKVSDFIWTVSPLIAWNSAAATGADNSVQLAYTPTFILYQDHTGNDTVNQVANVVYGYVDGRTRLIVSEGFNRFQENNADYNELGKETLSITTAHLDYQLTAKTSFQVVARQIYTEDDPGLESTERTFSTYAEYQITPKTTLGLGDVFGAVDLEGPNQTYEQMNGQITYIPDEKFSLTGTAGLEFRETQGSSKVNLTPDFTFDVLYEPFEGTYLNLAAYRRYEYSERFFGNDYLATGVAGSISQRFLRRFRLLLSSSFEDAQYHDNFSDSSADLGYDYLSIQPAVIYEPMEGLQFRAFYQYRESWTRGAIAGFIDNQIGFTASFTY